MPSPAPGPPSRPRSGADGPDPSARPATGPETAARAGAAAPLVVGRSSSSWWWPWWWRPDGTSTTTLCSPAAAQSVQQFITVPPDKSHPVTHPVLLTDVEIGRVTALTLPLLQAPEQHHARTGGGGHRRDAPLAADGPGQPRDVPGRGRRQGGGPDPTGLHRSRPPRPGAVIFGTFPGTPAYGVAPGGGRGHRGRRRGHPDGPGPHHRAVPLPLGPDRRADRAQGWVGGAPAR